MLSFNSCIFYINSGSYNNKLKTYNGVSVVIRLVEDAPAQEAHCVKQILPRQEQLQNAVLCRRIDVVNVVHDFLVGLRGQPLVQLNHSVAEPVHLLRPESLE